MRIGILTFCNAKNLGCALQAFSLQKALEEMGHDTELIDYRCPAIENMHKPKPVFHSGISMKSRVYNLLHNIVFFPRRIRYRRFQKYTKRSDKYSRKTIVETNGKYDLFISGSDQVFNYKLTGNDSTFFLDYVEKGVKASYAASLGTYLPEQRENYLKNLKSFDFLSVREESSAKILEEELGLASKVMPDPVFLHTAEEWIQLVGIADNKPKEKYILVYSLIEAKELYQVANKIATENGLKVWVITKALKPAGKSDRCLRNVGPKEFIKLISSAEFVVTNSFHGTAFSLVFQKQFTSVLPPNAPERIVDLLDYVGLKDYVLDNPKAFIPHIDFSKSRLQIDEMIKEGKIYLQMITKMRQL